MLDACFGMGVNSLALTQLQLYCRPSELQKLQEGRSFEGYKVHGLSMSQACIEKAEQLLQERGLPYGPNEQIDMQVGSFFHLGKLPQKFYDVVLVLDNSIALCIDVDMIALALTQISAKVRPGGLVLVGMKDYDQIIGENGDDPSTLSLDTSAREYDGRFPVSYTRKDERIVHFQNWSWTPTDPERRLYMLEHYLLRGRRDERASHRVGEWAFRTTKTTVPQRAITRPELAQALREAGFVAMKWLRPHQTGYAQDVCVGLKPL